MQKEEFLYQYLVQYNKYENNITGRSVVYWREQKNDGMVFCAIRNLLCHDTENSLNEIADYMSFKDVLASLKELALKDDARLRLIKFMLYTTNIEKIL